MRTVTSALDWVAITLLWVMIALGVLVTVGYNVFGPGYDYRESVSLWMRGIFWLQPDVSDIAAAPWIFQLHATVAWLFLALFPFTRFVHFWSAPVWYLSRPFVLYRRRRGQGGRPLPRRITLVADLRAPQPGPEAVRGPTRRHPAGDPCSDGSCCTACNSPC